MGRQVLFHMLPEDFSQFLKFVQERDPVIISVFDSDSPAITTNVPNNKETLCLWNQALLPNLTRKFIPESKRGPYYRIDNALPVLELSPSLQTVWNGYPGLLQGRIYESCTTGVAGFMKWFLAITGWIRRHCEKNPVKLLKGYVAPHALKWYQQGGVLLPMFMPPDTLAWRAVVEAQHGLPI